MHHQPILVVASGGMGKVQLVLRHDGAYQRLVALKRPLTAHGEARDMFLEEARLAGLIRHSNVVSVLDVGEDDEGPFLVMDYVDGPSVGHLLQKLAGEALPVQVALDIARQVAAGLQAAHELRSPDGQHLELVHRDVSPANILLGFDGLARLTDFGIARANGSLNEQTAEGILKGKMGYMAPELLRFQPATVQSDLFAFGVVLFEMLSGRRLYGGTSRSAGDIARSIMHDAPPDLGYEREDIPPAIDALLFDLLAKEPAQRPESVAGVAEQLDRAWTECVRTEGRLPLETLLLHHCGDARVEREREIEAALIRAATAEAVPDPARRLRWLVPLGALAVVGVATFAISQTRNAQPPSASAPTELQGSLATFDEAPQPSTRDSTLDASVDSPMAVSVGIAAPMSMARTRPRPRMNASMQDRPFGTWEW